MRLAIFGDERHKLEALLRPHEGAFELVADAPDCIVAFGGDGTLMRAEASAPGIPKLLIRNSDLAKLAAQRSNDEILEAFFKGAYHIVERMKLSVSVDGEVRADALNDVVVHNENPRHAIRYAIRVNGASLYERVIGDGIVCATPLGSTGYYRSITDSYFETGIGLAFNNSTEQTDHIVLKEDSRIELEVLRGPGFCYADNQEASFPLAVGSVVRIQKSPEKAHIISV